MKIITMLMLFSLILGCAPENPAREEEDLPGPTPQPTNPEDLNPE
jgi:hypothetical protein